MRQKILVPLDGSDFAEAILEEVEELAAGGQAEVILFRVGPWPREVMVEGGRVIYLDEQLSWAESEMVDYLKAVERRLGALGREVRSAVAFGDPASEILRYAGENGVSLIAMATHARRGLESLWRSSVARRVYQGSTVPVLLKKWTGKEAVLKAA